VEVSQSHVDPLGQQVVQPQRVWSGEHNGTHLPPTSCCPQGQLVGGGNASHLPLLHVCPAGHVPVRQIPPQPSSPPQALFVQLGVQHSQTEPEAMHLSPGAHPPEVQTPPQPSSAPQALPEQLGTQTHLPLLHTSLVPGQVPDVQVPPQPSGAPQTLFVQSG